MDYRGLLREVEEGRVPTIILLHGSEPFLLDDALAQITRCLFPALSSAALDREVFEGRETTPEAIVRAALTFPFAAPVRLVVVKGAQGLPSKGRDALEAYVKAPNPSSRLVFLAAEQLPATHWLLPTVPPAAVVEARGMSGREVVRWLKARAEVGGIEVTEEAANLLIQWVGDDLASLYGELQKAALATGPANRRVGVEEVKAVVGEHRLRSVFELTHAIERRAMGQATIVLEALLGAGEDPLKLLGMMTREVRVTWLVKEWLRQGKSAEEIARLLRRPRQSVEPLFARSESLSPHALSRRLAGCWEVERRIKSGGLPKPELTALLAEILGIG
jgi:DNA polymerase-3 subunit delta